MYAFVSGHPALDFLGTLQYRRGRALELLAAPEDLATWVLASGLVDEFATPHPDNHARALRLREAVYRLVRAGCADHPKDENDCALLNQEAAGPRVRLQLSADGTLRRSGTTDAVLSELASLAIELLTGPAAKSVRECAAQDCTRLYVDKSRRRSRRWCAMGDCGNRAKVADFRARQDS